MSPLRVLVDLACALVMAAWLMVAIPAVVVMRASNWLVVEAFRLGKKRLAN